MEEDRYRWIADHVLPFERAVRSWLRRRVPTLSAGDIDDLVQEAYARLWSADHTAIKNARTVFYTVVHNLWRDQQRRSRVVRIEYLEDSISLHVDEAPGPEQRVSARQQLERLVEIVQQLPPRQRAVFEGKHFSEMSTREIAQRMSIDEKTVRMHWQLALARVMRAILAEDVVCHDGKEADERERRRKQD